MIIRDVKEEDFSRIVELNSFEEASTSPIDVAALSKLHGMANYHRVISIADQIEGFLLVIPSGQNYHSENYHWFSARYSNFLYIDRIVLNKNYAGRGFGAALYSDLFRVNGVGNNLFVCEYNLDPLNTASKALHQKYAFNEVGRHLVAGKKLVSMQALKM